MLKFKLIMPILMAVFILSSCSNSPEKIENSLAGAEVQLNNLDFKKAEMILDELKAADSSNPDNIYLEGLILEKKLLYLDALAQYESLINSHPEYAEAYNGAYRCYKNLDAPNEMVIAARGYKNFAADSTAGLLVMGEALLDIGDYIQTRRNFQMVNAVGENPIADIYLAHSFAIQNVADSVQYYFERGMKAGDHSDYDFVKSLAEFYALIGKRDSSLTIIQEYINQHPYELAHYVDYLDLAISFGYYSDVHRVLNLLEEKNISKFITLRYRLQLAYDRNDVYVIRNQTSFYFMLNNKRLNLILSSMIARCYLTEELAASQDYLMITGNLERYDYPQKLKEYGKYKAALELARGENSTKSHADLSAIEGVYSDYRDLIIALLFNSYKIGLFDEAMEEADSLRKEYTSSPVWLNDLGQFYAHEDVEKYSTASNLFRLALASRPLYPEVFTNFINMYIQKQDYKAALKLYDEFSLLAEHPAYQLTKARLYLLDDNYEDFLKQFKNGMVVDKGDIREIRKIYNVLLDRDNKNEYNDFLAVLEDNKNGNSELNLLAGELSLKLEKFDEASKYLTEAEKLDPVDPNIKIHFARSKYYTGDKEGAFQIFEEVVKAHPNMPDNNLYYSYLLAAENRDLQKAANLARGAVFGSKGLSKYILNLSEIYYQMGRYDLAKGEAYKAMTTDRKNPECYYQLGRTWAKLTDREEHKQNATDALNRAIELGLEGEHLEDAKKLLKAL